MTRNRRTDGKPEALDHASASIAGYAIIECIGSGGMAKVYSAESAGITGFRKRVAIKRPHSEMLDRETVEEMFCAEAAIQAQLDHPGIAQVFDFGKDETG